MSLPLQIRSRLAVAAVALLAAPPLATGQDRIPREQLQAILERTLAAGALPDDPNLDRDELAASLDAFIAASPQDPLTTLAQRAAWRVLVSAAATVVVLPTKPGLLVHTDGLALARPWVLRGDVDISVDGGPWMRGDSFVARAPGCGGVTAPLPPAPGVHRVISKVTLTFFESTDEKSLCWHGTPGARPDPAVAAYFGRSPRQMWREVRETSFSYGVYSPPGIAGRLPDDYFLALARTTAAALEGGLPDVPVEWWLIAAIGERAETRPGWTLDYCSEEREADGSRPLCGQALVRVRSADGSRVIVRLQVGRVTSQEQWQMQRPVLREAFITSNLNSIDVRRLADLGGALAAPPDAWPAVDLEVSSRDISFAVARPQPGAVTAPLWIGATVRNAGLRDAPRVSVRLFVGCDERAPSLSGRPGMVDPRGEVRRVTVRDIAANEGAKFEWEIAPPCATPWILVHAFYIPRSDGWKAIAFEPDGENNFAAVRVGTGERVR